MGIPPLRVGVGVRRRTRWWVISPFVGVGVGVNINDTQCTSMDINEHQWKSMGIDEGSPLPVWG